HGATGRKPGTRSTYLPRGVARGGGTRLREREAAHQGRQLAIRHVRLERREQTALLRLEPGAQVVALALGDAVPERGLVQERQEHAREHHVVVLLLHLR